MWSRNRKSRLFWVAFAVVGLVISSPRETEAQGQTAAATPPQSPEIHAVLEKIVHPKRVKVGDKVLARVTEPTKLTDGTELAKGIYIAGKVTEIKLKADKEGPSKLGLLFDKAQLKDGKEVALKMALVSVAPRWEPGGVDPVAAENAASSAGRIAQLNGTTGLPAGSAGSDTLGKGLGVRGATPVSFQAMHPGVCYLQDVTIASYSIGEPGTILQSTKNTVYLDSGSRLLLLVQ